MNNITNRSDINELLQQMRSMREQVQPERQQSQPVDGLRPGQGVQPGQGVREGSASDAPGFTDMLRQAVDGVNDAQQKSGELQNAFQAGDPDVDITQVMVQMQKASVSFDAMNQVRNRLVSAYQDIMNMPI